MSFWRVAGQKACPGCTNSRQQPCQTGLTDNFQGFTESQCLGCCFNICLQQPTDWLDQCQNHVCRPAGQIGSTECSCSQRAAWRCGWRGATLTPSLRPSPTGPSPPSPSATPSASTTATCLPLPGSSCCLRCSLISTPLSVSGKLSPPPFCFYYGQLAAFDKLMLLKSFKDTLLLIAATKLHRLRFLVRLLV